MDNCLNSDHLIGIRAKTAAEEVNRLRNWKRTKERFEENKARIKKDCLAVLSRMSAFSWGKYTAALEAKGYKVKLKMDASVTVRGYSIQSGNSVYKSSVIGRELTPPTSHKTAEAADPPPTRTGVATRTKTTSSGPAVASARRGRWSLRR